MANTFQRERSRHASPRGGNASGVGRLRRVFADLRSLRVVVDSLIWFCAVAIGAAAAGTSIRHLVAASLVAVAVNLVVGSVAGLYRGRWRIGSYDEAVALTACTAATSAILLSVRTVFAWRGVAIGFDTLSPFVALFAAGAVRAIHRAQRSPRPAGRVDDLAPVLVFGAGDGAAQVISAMQRNRNSRYRPVAMLDDDPRKQNLRLGGIPVAGGRHDLAAVARATRCRTLLIAIPSAGASVIREVATLAEDAGLDVRILPPTQELVDGVVRLEDIRQLADDDLLGRRAIDMDLDAIASYVTGRRVLVTGAGGSIGSELCRQLSRFGPESLIMVDRDESGLHGVQLSLEGRALLDERTLVVADIRDAGRIASVFAEHQPHVVFHAAALKHLPLLEMYPTEAWKTNVLGTNNVLRAAAQVGATHVVNISTDKAASPSSVLGYSKRVAELLTAWYANRVHGDWVSVRFGNVLGSRGSVLEAFRAQVAAGGPITVTHPEVTRYFMTPSEAAQLVVQAAAVGSRGEALVLDMGEPVRILDVARRLAVAAPGPVDIEFTGLRQGEKLHEDLVGEGELDIRRSHPLISHVAIPPLAPGQLGRFDDSTPDRARDSLAMLAGEERVDSITLV